ncbi:hypothetical protein EIP91_001548 [Steccherinum ochraceum]|uniref:Uncharacterized protein n=1 Tax=Steccherinum ochraceum TaxID=92696 RepID=A0A4R0RGD3_9APHY|nr:hypothetical protein EIP91_001548 [Steccherinum ochraceum]
MPSHPPEHQAILDSLKRSFSYLDDRALGSTEVQQFIPEPEYKALVGRFRELRAQHAILDWTTAFPTIYTTKKTVKNFIVKATLPRKCRSLEKQAQKWRKDADLVVLKNVAAAADRECQHVRKEKLDRYRRKYPTSIFDRNIACGTMSSPTVSEFAVPPRWEARSGSESNQSLPIDGGRQPATVPWLVTTDIDDQTSSLPSPGLSSRRSTISDPKRPTPWLTRTPSGNSLMNTPVVTETFRVRTISTCR